MSGGAYGSVLALPARLVALLAALAAGALAGSSILNRGQFHANWRIPFGNGPLVVELDVGGVDEADQDGEPDLGFVPLTRTDGDPAAGLGSGIWISAITSPLRTSSTTIIPVEVPRYTCLKKIIKIVTNVFSRA